MLAMLEQKDAEIAKLQKQVWFPNQFALSYWFWTNKSADSFSRGQVAAFMELGLDKPQPDEIPSSKDWIWTRICAKQEFIQ